jgi:arginyl-tRNA synthetase
MTNRQDYTVIEIIEKILKRVISNYSTFLGETNLNVNTIKISVERSRNLVFGDYSTNFLLTIDAQPNKIEQYAHYIINKLSNYRNFFSVVTFTKPGFINFFISTKWLLKNMKQILTMKKSYGRFNKKKLFYNIEFVSANPTGLLHIGHARNAAYGDALVNIWKTYGIKVNREYYINDAGNQIDKLALSVLIRYLQENNKVVKIPKDGYNGDEIVTIAKEVNKIYGTKYLNTVYDDEKITDPETNNFFRVFAVGNMLNMIRKSLASFSVKFDIFTSESSIYKTNLIDQVLYDLREYTYQKDGATFLKTTQFSDEKDRVLIKTDGTYTYFLPDIAYHKIKLLRNYDMIFNIWGADHKSYIERMSIAMQMLGFAKEKMHVFVQQMVHLTKNGKEFKMSKRSGDSITIDFLLDTIGKDAAR